MGKNKQDLKSLEKKRSTAKRSNEETQLGKHLAETAWRVALPFIVLSIGGIKLDEYLETSPLFSIVGVLLAVAAVSVIIYRYVNKYFPDTFGSKK